MNARWQPRAWSVLALGCQQGRVRLAMMAPLAPPASLLPPPPVSSESDVTSHREHIKTRDRGLEQQRRREAVLSSQRVRRAQLLSQSRGLDIGGQPCAVENKLDSVVTTSQPGEDENMAGDDKVGRQPSSAPRSQQQHRRGQQRRRRQPPASAALMLAEWMVDVPSDLALCWYVMARPAGWRCLVSTGGGVTRAQGRSGGKPRSFASALPGGSRHGLTQGDSGACELDCIWSETEQTYYVADVIVWNSQRLEDCPADFRLFWIHSKLSEGGVATHARGAEHPIRFVPLLALEASPTHLQTAYAGTPCFGAARDGLLFIHREALYEAGRSPLVLSWSDATCSARFFDYGSSQMHAHLEHAPEKAERWRTSELDAAVTYAELLAVAERPPMEEAAAEAEDTDLHDSDMGTDGCLGGVAAAGSTGTGGDAPGWLASATIPIPARYPYDYNADGGSTMQDV